MCDNINQDLAARLLAQSQQQAVRIDSLESLVSSLAKKISRMADDRRRLILSEAANLERLAEK